MPNNLSLIVSLRTTRMLRLTSHSPVRNPAQRALAEFLAKTFRLEDNLPLRHFIGAVLVELGVPEVCSYDHFILARSTRCILCA